MDTRQQKDVMEIDKRGQLVVRDSGQLHRYMVQLLASKGLPGHLTTVEQLWAAHAMLTAIGLDWRASLKDTWRNPTSGAISLCNDAPLAACQKRPDYVGTVEYHVNERNERRTRDNFIGFKVAGAVCIAKRKGREDQEGFFTLQEAKDAGIMGKKNWSTFPAAMLRMRARAIALRAQWPDVLGGVPIREGDEGFDLAHSMPPRPKPAQSLVIDMLSDEAAPADYHVPEAAQPAPEPPHPPAPLDEDDEDLEVFDRLPGDEED